MRKTKLLLLAFMAMLGMSVSAQSWTAPTIAGENPVSGTQYKLMNVGAAKYLAMAQAWFGWNTTATLTDNGINFTMTADGTNWKFISSGTNGVFTSGNEIPGDAMHIDNTAHTYGITQLPNGYYHIHDANGNEESPCWGYKFIPKTGGQAQRDSWGVVAHADAATIGANGEWVFLSDLSAVGVYKARLELYNLLNEAYSAGVNTNAAAGVYNDASATVDQLNAAYDALSAAMSVPAVIAYINGETGVDLSSFFDNLDFEAGNLTGWTSNGGGNAANNGNFSLHKGSWFVEKWTWGSGVSNGSLVHDAVYLPAGIYCITADAQNIRQDNNNAASTGLFLYANNNNVEIGAAASYSVYTTLDADGPLTIKFVINNCTGNWICYDNITVTYYAQASDLLAPAIAAAADLNGKIPAAAYAALQQVVSANNISSGTTEDYLAAANNINEAVATYTAMVAPYATWKELSARALALAQGHTTITNAINQVVVFVETITELSDLEDTNTLTSKMTINYQTWNEVRTYANALAAVSNNNATANQALQDAIANEFTVISNAPTSSKDEIAALIYQTLPTSTTAMRTAMRTYVNAAQPTNDECFELTGLIVNPHFTDGVGGRGQVAAGWTLESGAVTEHRLATHNFEAWHTQFNLSQTIADLPKGTYKVTLQGFARHDNANVTTKTNLYCGIVDQEIKNIQAEYSTTSFYNNNTPALGDNNRDSYDQATGYYRPNGMTGAYYWFQQTNPATGQPFYTNEVQTLITEAGDLKIGFKCEANEDWVIWDNFHLYYYGSAIAVTLDETAGSSFSEDIDNANVTLKKTIYEGWNTIVIPFEVGESDLTKLNATELYEFTEYDESAKKLMFSEATAIEPNIPYMLKASTASTGDFTFNNVTVKAATDLTTGEGGYNFVGTYQEVQVADGDYILYEKDGAAGFGRSSGGNKVKAYRAYIKRLEEGENPARLTISINGQTTAIDAIDGQTIGNGAIYNLAGQKVEKAQKGIYIQNGKKMVIK